MKKLYYRIWQKGKNEDGQSMLEFVLVLPVFMLLLAMTLDFGWYFYTQIGVENSARNAARVACVEYDRVAYDSGNKRPDVSYSQTGTATSYSKTYSLNDNMSVLNGTADETEQANSGLSDQEIRILNQVKNTIPSYFLTEARDVTVSIAYSYDKEYLTSPSAYGYKVANRSNGDVTVIVSGTHHAITPLVAWGTGGGTSMNRPIRCKAVYKVEANSFSSDN
ncbi:MAG: pilus assembly protein [Clostridia bacterium]|nr:pilus assembly protein [Clostridia bacterium]